MDELAAIKKTIQSANLPEDSQRKILWCLEHLPGLYEQLFATYDSRFREEILRLEQAMLRPLGRQTKKVAEAIHEQLQALHTRLGFEGHLRVPA
jgi:hypothetical protein